MSTQKPVIPPDLQVAHQQAVAAQSAVDFKRKSINTLIQLFNFPLSVAMLMGLNLIGWVNLKMEGGLWSQIALAAVIAVIYIALRKAFGFIYGMVSLFTCCTGFLLLPVYSAVIGFATLFAIQYLLPQYFTLGVGNIWIGIVAGLAFGAAQIPEIGAYSAPALQAPEEKEE